MSQRIELIERDLFELSPSDGDFGNYDVVTAIYLFHGYFYEGRERLLTLLRRLRVAFPRTVFLSPQCA